MAPTLGRDGQQHPGGVDLKAARRFLEILGGYDGCHTFQTFDDTPRRNRGLARILHGTLDQHADELLVLNLAGAGVYVTVNQTDGQGRSRGNVVALRALFVDDDGEGLGEYPLPPTMVVHSPQGPHAYWALRKGELLWRFPEAQKRLAAVLRTDPKVCDLPRVMRLPGFDHCKKAPIRVGLGAVVPWARYTIGEVMAALPPKPEPRQGDSFRAPAGGVEDGWWHKLRRPIAQGSRNDDLFRIGVCMRRRDHMDPGDILVALRDLNARLCDEPLPDAELCAMIRSIGRMV